MAKPTILFNNASGSDTAASGAGPATAVTNTDGSFSGTTVTLPNADLSGVATDGSHILWLKTSSGRQFFTITATSGSGTAGAAVTVTETPAGTTTARTYAIGGKRKTLDNTDSRTLFVVTNGAKPGWTIQLEDDQTISSAIPVAALGDTTTGMIVLQGDSESTRRVVTNSANAAIFNDALGGWHLKNLHGKCSNATRTSSYFVDFNSGSATVTRITNCVMGDATNKLQSGITRAVSAQPSLILEDCEIKNCLGPGINTWHGNTSIPSLIANCWIHNNGSGGILQVFGNVSGITTIRGCIVANNTGIAIRIAGGNRPCIENCTIHGNTSDGVKIDSINSHGGIVRNNSITANGGYGLNWAIGTQAYNDTAQTVTYNNFGNASDSTANTSGATTGVSQGTGCFSTAPAYTNAAGNDFSVGASSPNKATGYPPSSRYIGANNSATLSYVDVGAAQRAEPTGGALSRIFTGF